MTLRRVEGLLGLQWDTSSARSLRLQPMPLHLVAPLVGHSGPVDTVLVKQFRSGEQQRLQGSSRNLFPLPMPLAATMRLGLLLGLQLVGQASGLAPLLLPSSDLDLLRSLHLASSSLAALHLASTLQLAVVLLASSCLALFPLCPDLSLLLLQRVLCLVLHLVPVHLQMMVVVALQMSTLLQKA
jgi:hypothetical protein